MDKRLARVAGAALTISLAGSLSPPPSAAPYVAAQQPGTNGLIAFNNAGSVWLADPDGSDPRVLREAEWEKPGNGNAGHLDWRPGESTLGILVHKPNGAEFRHMEADESGEGVFGNNEGQPIAGWHKIGWTPDGLGHWGLLDVCEGVNCDRERRFLVAGSDDGDYAVEFQEPIVAGVFPERPWVSSVSHIHSAAPAWTPDGSAVVMVLPECSFFGVGVDVAPPTLPPGICNDLSYLKGAALYVWQIGDDKPTLIHELDEIEGLDENGFGNTTIEKVDVSPDGRQVVMEARSNDGPPGEESAAIWIMGMDGSDPRVLTRGASGSARNPTWAPDGTKIAFSEPYRGIYTIPPAGGTPTELVPGVDVWDMAWQCRGPTCKAVSAEVRIIKDVLGYDDQYFPATFTYSGSVRGTITHTGASGPLGDFYLQRKVRAGRVTVREQNPAGWKTVAIVCNKTYTADAEAGSVTISLRTGESAVCTFTSESGWGPDNPDGPDAGATPTPRCTIETTSTFPWWAGQYGIHTLRYEVSVRWCFGNGAVSLTRGRAGIQIRQQISRWIVPDALSPIYFKARDYDAQVESVVQPAGRILIGVTGGFDACTSVGQILDWAAPLKGLLKAGFKRLPRKVRHQVRQRIDKVVDRALDRLTRRGAQLSIEDERARQWLVRELSALIGEVLNVIIGDAVPVTEFCVSTWSPSATITLHASGSKSAIMVGDASPYWTIKAMFE